MTNSANLVIHNMRDVTVVNVDETNILDATQVEAIGDQLYDLVDNRDRRKLVIDFSKVRLLSSSALGMLITLNKKSKAIKGQVILCGLRPDLTKIFTITRLDKMFNFCDNEQAALKKFGVATA